MDWPSILPYIAAGTVVGAVAVYILLRSRLDREREGRIRSETALEKEREAAGAREALLATNRDEMIRAFQALSGEALRRNNQAFLDLARTELEGHHLKARSDLESRKRSVEELVKPLAKSLDSVNREIRVLEEARKEAYGGLTERIKGLAEAQERLHVETESLASALRAPTARGRWGEIQLRRVVELAGMTAHCDFTEQTEVRGEAGRIRPDLLIHLPGNKQVVVDAKTPLSAYLASHETGEDRKRRKCLEEHAALVRRHILKLSSKAYWDQFDEAPDFVVMFLPGEAIFGAAVEADPTLIEEGVTRQVILATPTTLIALLRAVAYGWRQEKMTRSARQIGDLGRELHDRIRILAEHFSALGKGLDRAVEQYNRAVGSLEHRVLAAARRFTDLGAPTRAEIPVPEAVEKKARSIQADVLNVEGERIESVLKRPPLPKNEK